MFIWKKFIRSMAVKGGTTFLALLAALAAGPAVAPMLSMLGITIQVMDAATVITIQHAVFAAGVGTLAVMGFEASRVLLAKHQSVPLPQAVKDAIG